MILTLKLFYHLSSCDLAFLPGGTLTAFLTRISFQTAGSVFPTLVVPFVVKKNCFLRFLGAKSFGQHRREAKPIFFVDDRFPDVQLRPVHQVPPQHGHCEAGEQPNANANANQCRCRAESKTLSWQKVSSCVLRVEPRYIELWVEKTLLIKYYMNVLKMSHCIHPFRTVSMLIVGPRPAFGRVFLTRFLILVQ